MSHLRIEERCPIRKVANWIDTGFERKDKVTMEKKIRLLRADEIECRAASVNENGVSLLLYKDARVDQKILDETFGMFGWKRSHQCINGNLYCTVEVYDSESGCWVAKQDVGTVGNYEKEKSQASDSFKRACFNWGIGRELYSAPFIWVTSRDAQVKKKDGKYYCNDRFRVSSIHYNNSNEIISLTIKNDSQKGKTVYQLVSNNASPEPAQAVSKSSQAPKKPASNTLTDKQMQDFESELHRTGIGIAAVKNRYGFHEPQDMTADLYNRVMRALAKTKSADGAA